MSTPFFDDFPCTGCSLCCRNVEKIHSNALNYPKDSIIYRAAAAFPYSWNKEGCCTMLENNLCSIYSSRPLLCNVKELSKCIAVESNIDLNSIYALTATECNNLISANNLDPRFMIDPSQFK